MNPVLIFLICLRIPPPWAVFYATNRKYYGHHSVAEINAEKLLLDFDRRLFTQRMKKSDDSLSIILSKSGIPNRNGRAATPATELRLVVSSRETSDFWRKPSGIVRNLIFLAFRHISSHFHVGEGRFHVRIRRGFLKFRFQIFRFPPKLSVRYLSVT